MATASRSAAEAATQLFGTVTTAANAATTAINTIGNAFDVLNTKSTAWLKETRQETAASSEHREYLISRNVSIEIAKSEIELETMFAGNAKLKAVYDRVFESISATVKAAA